ncbi:MAG: O-succinylhomoserine sulfhydrylase, partial [Pseudonocardiales bacterium]|nr:O-succinylhomoserine sulfhydrylase [Pseudonocardiales bacterium]
AGGHLILSATLPDGMAIRAGAVADGRTVSMVAATDYDGIEAGLSSSTQLIVVETLTLPYLDLVNVGRLAEFCHSHDLLLLIDNTALGDDSARPASLGATLSCSSARSAAVPELTVVSGEALAMNLARREPWLTHEPEQLSDAGTVTIVDPRKRSELADLAARLLRECRWVSDVFRPTFHAQAWARESHLGLSGQVAVQLAVDSMPLHDLDVTATGLRLEPSDQDWPPGLALMRVVAEEEAAVVAGIRRLSRAIECTEDRRGLDAAQAGPATRAMAP